MKRARNDEEKRSRREEILGAAAALFEENNFRRITMTALAKTAGIAKGTVFLYFDTKESVYLSLLERMVDEWARETAEKISRNTKRLSSPEEAFGMVMETLSSPHRRLLMRLLVILEPILLQNVSQDRRDSFRTALLDDVEVVGQSLEKVGTTLESGAGSKSVLELLGAALGIAQISGVVHEVDLSFNATRDIRKQLNNGCPTDMF